MPLNSMTFVPNQVSLSALDNTDMPRHRWYHFKEAFSPNVVNYALEDAQCNKTKDLIIDPFSGSGTVAVTSTLNGYKAIGFEVNPFLAFVSATKLTQCRSNTIHKQLHSIIASIRRGEISPLEHFSTFSDTGDSEKWLFNKQVLRAFEGGWVPTSSMYKPVRDVARLCLIGAAMDACNAAKDGKCLRYRKDWKERSFGVSDFVNAFEKRMQEVIDDLEISPINKDIESFIKLGDSRKMSSDIIQNQKFKLCVMSPPYLNSFDYTDVYRPELFLGRFVLNNEQLQILRHNTLRSHVQVKWAEPHEEYFGRHFFESFQELNERRENLWNNRIPLMVQAYFEDMKKILVNLMSLAKKDASVWIVVSTSAYAGVELPVDLIIADIATQVGWYLRDIKVIRYLKRVSGQQWDELSKRKEQRPHLRESIIILDAKPKKS